MFAKTLSTSGAAFSLAIGLITVGTPSPAKAALACVAGSCTETVSFGPTSTDFVNAVLTLDKFNASLFPGQTLNDVKLSFGGTFNSTGSITNGSSSTQSATFVLGTDFRYTAGLGAPVGFLTSAVDVLGSATPFSGPLAAGASSPYTLSLALTPVGLATITTNLSGFIGSGTFALNASTFTYSTITGGGGNISALERSNGTAEVTITYDFSPAVPEPTTWAMMILGFASVGFMAVRRKRFLFVKQQSDANYEAAGKRF